MRVITVNEATGERVFSRTEVATICGVSNQSLRLWEDAGVIPQSTRDENNYRYWTEEQVEQIKEYAEIPYKVKRGIK
jgi:DNA-binding transcriptional MerR regulator